MEITNTIKLYSLSYKDFKTYLFATLFVVGNIILPQLTHIIPNGGVTLLPIFFFTLIGAYKYGWKVGLLTAILSPLINHLLFGMPPINILPIILMKSTLLAFVAAFAAHHFQRVSIPILLLVVLAYQIAGTLVQSVMVEDLQVALVSFKTAIPGMLLQVFGGYLVIKYLIKN